jgi:hypothetical protein
MQYQTATLDDEKVFADNEQYRLAYSADRYRPHRGGFAPEVFE